MRASHCLKMKQRILLRLFLNDRQSNQVPVDTEVRLLLLNLACLCKMYLRLFSRVDRLAADSEFFFEDPQFFEPVRKVECDNVLVDLGFQLHLDFKSNGYVCASAREVLRRHQIGYSVRTSRDLL